METTTYSEPFGLLSMLPSCVPAADLDESGAVLEAEDLRARTTHRPVLWAWQN